MKSAVASPIPVKLYLLHVPLHSDGTRTLVLYQKHGILRVKRRIGSVNDTKYSELMQCISRCCNVLTVKLYQCDALCVQRSGIHYEYRIFLVLSQQ